MGTIETISPFVANISQPSMAELRFGQSKWLTFSGCFVAKEFEESSKVRTQMTASIRPHGASRRFAKW